MITTYSNSTFIFNCDWLAFSVLIESDEPEFVCPDGIRIEFCQGNNIFEHRALIFSARGEKLLTLLWKPYSAILNKRVMTVQVANQSLYVQDGMGILWAWELLQSIVTCTWNAVSRIDLCVDFEVSLREIEFFSHLNSNHYYVQGKREGSAWWHSASSDDFNKKQLHCLSWGAPKSEIKVKTYYKSREQNVLNGNADTAEKPWIVQEWKEAGLDIKKIWRLEFSLTGAGQLSYNNQPITLDNVSNPQWIINTFLELYHTRFITRINQGRRVGHKNNDRRIFLLNIPKRARSLRWKESTNDTTECPPAIKLLRSLMHNLDNTCVMASRQTFDIYAGAIVDFVTLHKLDGYFLRTWQQHPQDYFEDLYQEIGCGIHKLVLSPNRLSE